MRNAFKTISSVALAAVALSAAAIPTVARAGDTDAALLAEINFARTQPQAYARKLLLQPVSAWERNLAQPVDAGALAEAIEFLERQSPLPPLSPDDALAAAALEHVEDQGAAGKVGHDGPGGEHFDARLRRHGIAGRWEGENIAYGPARPADVVRELIIDSGVPDRGHRRNFFLASFEVAGVTCGPHRDYGAMCVIDFAGAPPAQAARRAEVPVEIAAEPLAETPIEIAAASPVEIPADLTTELPEAFPVELPVAIPVAVIVTADATPPASNRPAARRLWRWLHVSWPSQKTTA